MRVNTFVLREEMPIDGGQGEGSLLDGGAVELSEGEYFLADGIKGAGDRPEWYKSEKYKSVAEQARAYTELEKKFGSFVGAPKEGYELPEDLDREDELVKQVIEWGTANNLSQNGFNDLLNLAMAQSSAVEQVSQEAELAKIGDNFHQRKAQLEKFLIEKTGDSYDQVKEMITNADQFLLAESIMKHVQPQKLPIDGHHVPGKPTLQEIEAFAAAKDENGNPKRRDPSYEARFQQMLKEYAGDGDHHIIVHG